MKNPLFRLPEDKPTQAHTAFLIAAAIAFVHFVAVVYYLYLARTTGTVQFNTLAVISLVLGVIIGLGAELSRRGRITLGMILALGSMALSYPVVSMTLVGGLGLVLGLALMAIGPMSAFQVMSSRPGRVTTVVTFLSGLATLLLDVFGPAARPSLQGIVIQLLAASVMGLVIFFVARQFRDYSLRTKLVLGFMSVIVLAGLVAIFIIQQQLRAAEQTAATEAGHVAETLGTVLSRAQSELQELIEQLHDTQQREIRVVDLEKRILASAVPGSIGTIYDADQNEEVAATLMDGQPRSFLETSAEYPQGINQVVVPVRDEETGTIIIGAVMLDYTQALQQTSLDGAEALTAEISTLLARDSAGLQNFINVLSTARRQDMVVVDLQKRIAADSQPENIGAIYTRDLGGEVTTVLQDGQPRTFSEVNVNHPRGIQQVVTPIKDPSGQIIGATILGTNPEVERNAIFQAIQMAEAISAEVSQNQARTQELVTQLSESLNRELVVVGPDREILAAVVPEEIGTIFEHDPNGEIAATLNDGQPRYFADISQEHEQELKQVVVPIRDEAGSINGAIIFDYTSLEAEIQQTANAASRTLIAFGLGGLLITFVISQFISTSIANPITQLSNAAQKIGSGELDTSIPLRSSNDEVGILTKAFINMSNQLRDLIGSLEQRVSDRTKALATSAEVSRRLSTILDQKQLVAEVVEQVKSTFDYYHAHIYLTDDSSGDLIMMGGTGDAGAAMLAQGHKLPRGRGLVGRAAETRETVLVSDVAKEPGWLPNPLLPNTKSEVALPIIFGGKVLGVLDVQQNSINGFGERDINLLQSIAGQVAVSLQNARSFEQARAQADLETQVNVISQKIQRAASVEDVLQTAIREVGLTLGAARVTARLQASQPVTDHAAGGNNGNKPDQA